MALDGQKKFSEALAAFSEILEKAQEDSYYQSEAMFEVGRLNLMLAMEEQDNREERLAKSFQTFGLWLERDWTPILTKAWGYYHQACILHLWIEGTQDSAKKSELELDFAKKQKSYLDEVRSFTGWQRRHHKFARVLMLDPNEKYLPGDPVKCGLEEKFFMAPY
jgi:hypothetical protein